jgi:glyoxylase-like metal-dependent hydrolase (beta-lactamase superfamily II)/rhodanese-related sulfurtransferase
MMLRQILNEDLACASYLVADGGVAAVVDPQWDVREYLRIARFHRLRIAHVVETHVHADHLSGRARLAAATGAAVHLPAGSGAADPHAPLDEGDVIALGGLELRVLATPGHRPEHIALLAADRGRPFALLAGDSLQIGDAARPDLATDAVAGARALWASLRRLDELGDDVELWPGHVGGSLCGGSALSGRTVSTLGNERRRNRVLGLPDVESFVGALTERLPPRPPTASRLVRLNRNPPHGSGGTRPRLDARSVQRLLDDGAILVDGRPGEEFDRAHPPGAVSLDAGRPGAGTRAGRALDPELPLVVSAESDGAAERLALALEAVGFGGVLGVLEGGLPGWLAAGLPGAAIESISVDALAAELRRGEATLIDVREADEWARGHAEGSLSLPLSAMGMLPWLELEDGVRPVVACSTGLRSGLAASLLARAGRHDVRRVAAGGVPDLVAHGIALVAGDEPAAPRRHAAA